MEKRCSRCREIKALSEFCRKARFSDGLNTWCRTCASEVRRLHYERNRAKEIATALAWQEGHRYEKRLADRRYLKRHGDRLRDAAKARYATNPAPARARGAQWKRDNPERVAEQCGRRRAQKLATQAEALDYAAIFERDGGRCHICLLPVERGRVHFDHVIPLARGGTHTTANVRVTHPRCNLVKAASI